MKFDEDKTEKKSLGSDKNNLESGWKITDRSTAEFLQRENVAQFTAYLWSLLFFR